MQKIIDNTLRCSKCEQRKSLDCFTRANTTKTGYAYWCKPCIRAKRLHRLATATPEQLLADKANQRAGYARWLAKHNGIRP